MTLGELLKKFSTLSGRYQSFKNFAFGLANALQLYNSTRYFRHCRAVPTGHDAPGIASLLRLSMTKISFIKHIGLLLREYNHKNIQLHICFIINRF